MDTSRDSHILCKQLKRYRSTNRFVYTTVYGTLTRFTLHLRSRQHTSETESTKGNSSTVFLNFGGMEFSSRFECRFNPSMFFIYQSRQKKTVVVDQTVQTEIIGMRFDCRGGVGGGVIDLATPVCGVGTLLSECH